jgi:hypothetical protein
MTEEPRQKRREVAGRVGWLHNELARRFGGLDRLGKLLQETGEESLPYALVSPNIPEGNVQNNGIDEEAKDVAHLLERVAALREEKAESIFLLTQAIEQLESLQAAYLELRTQHNDLLAAIEATHLPPAFQKFFLEEKDVSIEHNAKTKTISKDKNRNNKKEAGGNERNEKDEQIKELRSQCAKLTEEKQRLLEKLAASAHRAASAAGQNQTLSAMSLPLDRC